MKKEMCKEEKKKEQVRFTPQCYHTNAISLSSPPPLLSPSVTSAAHQLIRYQRGRTQRETDLGCPQLLDIEKCLGRLGI